MEATIIPGLDLPVKSIYCIGRNYAEHAKELNNPLPTSPLVFLKPQSSICYDGDEILIPTQSSDVHHEVELVVAISKICKNASESESLDYISGAGIGIDFTARDIQQKAKELGQPWTVAKGFDTFAPISNFIPLVEIENVQNLDLKLSVNDSVKQSGNTSQMIFSIKKIVSFLSGIFTLYPGDLIFTGTPSGVSSIKSKDVITASLGKNLISLTVTVK